MLKLLIGIFLLASANAICPMQNSKFSCNNDIMGCGWYHGKCVSCYMTKQQNRCEDSHYCMWDSDNGQCRKKDQPVKDCSLYKMSINCNMDNDCKWSHSKRACEPKTTCAQIKSHTMCKLRTDCELKARKCVDKIL